MQSGTSEACLENCFTVRDLAARSVMLPTPVTGWRDPGRLAGPWKSCAIYLAMDVMALASGAVCNVDITVGTISALIVVTHRQG